LPYIKKCKERSLRRNELKTTRLQDRMTPCHAAIPEESVLSGLQEELCKEESLVTQVLLKPNAKEQPRIFIEFNLMNYKK